MQKIIFSVQLIVRRHSEIMLNLLLINDFGIIFIKTLNFRNQTVVQITIGKTVLQGKNQKIALRNFLVGYKLVEQFQKFLQ